MLGILSNVFGIATRTNGSVKQNHYPTHEDMLFEHQRRKAEEMRLNQRQRQRNFR